MGNDSQVLERDRKAAEIFGRVTDLPTVDRPAAIRAACGDDAALLANVEELAAVLGRAQGFLSDLTVDAAADHFARTMAAAPVGEKPGDRIGRYKLLEQIGEGGFGVVFMAEQELPVRRQVALKVIKLGMDTRDVVARFEAERQALAMMDHPNIAKVLDAGATDAGRPYFVMELVRGSPITAYADKHKLSTADRVALAAQVCRAVQHAHSKGIIHRDIKPTNVLVTVADDKPVPKVIDFGIAKATQAKLTDRTLFTGYRQLIGTPQYMSPEQADSDGVDVDTRTDVYSLGVLLYELLVGTTPFDAKQLRSAAFEAMRKMIRDQEPARPSTRLNTLGDTLATVAAARGVDAKQLGKQVHGELDWIVMRALEKDRSRRYDTAAAMADDLNRYLAGEAVLAGPASAAYRLRKLARRYKLAVGVAGAIAACLLLGVAGTTWGLVQARHERAAAVTNERRALAGEADARRQKAAAEAAAVAANANAREAERAGDEARANAKQARDEQATAKATLDFVTDLLARASPAKTRDASVSRVLVDKLIAPALARVAGQFDRQPRVRASIQDTLATTLLNLGRPDLAAPPAKAAYDARRRVQGDDHPDTLGALNNYALAIDAQGRHAEAERLFKQCWDARRRVQGDDHPDTLTALNNYAPAIDAQGRHAEAERLYKQCWDARRRVQGDDHPNTLGTLDNYAFAIEAQGRYAEAEPLFRQAADGYHRTHPDDPSRGIVLYRLGRCLAAQHKWAEAEAVARENWAWDRTHPDPTRGAVPMSLQLLNDCLRHEGKPLEGGPATRPMAAPTTAPAAVASAADAAALVRQAVPLVTTGHSAAAEPLLRPAADYYRRSAPDDAGRGPALYALGLALANQHKWADAEAVLRENWAFDRTHPAPDRKPGTVPGSLKLLNRCLKAQGKPAEPTTAPATRP